MVMRRTLSSGARTRSASALSLRAMHQAFGDVAKVCALTDARHDRRGLRVQARGHHATERRADRRRLHGRLLTAMHLLEGVVPQRANPAERFAAVVLHALHVAEQVQNAGDVIQVDVADERHAQVERARAPQLIDARAEDVSVDASRAAVDEDAQCRRVGPRVMEQQTVAVVCLQRFDGEACSPVRPTESRAGRPPCRLPGNAVRGRGRWRSGRGCP